MRSFARQRSTPHLLWQCSTGHPSRRTPRRLVECRGYQTTLWCAALKPMKMPSLSPTMETGGISTWKLKPGDSYSAGDVMLEVETDKATMDVEAADDGILAKIVMGDGEKNVKVGKLIAVIGEEGDEVNDDAIAKVVEAADKESAGGKGESEAESDKPKESTDAKEEKSKETSKEKDEPVKDESSSKPKEDKKRQDDASSEKGKPEQASASPSGSERTFASPVAKRLANERKIDLSQVKGSGPNGRITKEDIENFKPSSKGKEETDQASPPPAADTDKPQEQAATPPGGQAPAKTDSKHHGPEAFTDIPLSNMRRTIAGRLTQSKQNLPHYYVTATISMDRTLKLRETFNNSAGDKGFKLSVNDFVIKAAAAALREVPAVNSAWYGEFIRQHNYVDISMAVATPNGLITPIVTDVTNRGLISISQRSKELAKKARDGKLKPEEYQGGTFSISNMGMLGTEVFTAIINPPQSGILAIGQTESRLVEDANSEKGFRVEKIMKVTLSADHRVVDGAVGAQWMAAFKRYMENPLTQLL